MNKQILKYTALIILTVGLASCKKKGCSDELAANYDPETEQDDGSCVYGQFNINYEFEFQFNGETVTKDDLAELKYTNANGEEMSITKLQYSISDFNFINEDGSNILTDEYHLIDIEDESSLKKSISQQVVAGSYSGISFNFGFNEEDNVDGAYTDLNVKSWSSPMMLGGGYHQMKLEGNFIDEDGIETGYQYHNLSTIRKIEGEDTTFHANFFEVNFDNEDFTINTNKTITLVMHIDQWFEAPNLWDLNDLHSMLMPNYNAQVLMRENGNNVFTVSSIE